MSRIMGFLLGIALALMGVSPPLNVQAQVRTLRGVVVDTRPNATPPTITVRHDDTTTTIRLSESVVVQKRGPTGAFETARISDIKVGDEVLVSLNERGEAIAVLVRRSAEATLSPVPQVPAGLAGFLLDPLTGKVAAVYADSPAEQSGLQTGDLVIQADGIRLVPPLTESVLAQLQGPEGTSMELVVLRGGEQKVIQVTRVGERRISRGAVSFAAPRPKVWTAFLSVIIGQDFNAFFKVRQVLREEGIILFESAIFSEQLKALREQKVADTSRLVRPGALGEFLPVNVRVTPSVRFSDRPAGTLVLLNLTIEVIDQGRCLFICQWTSVPSAGAIESRLFVQTWRELDKP